MGLDDNSGKKILKARIYMYDRENVIKKLVYVYADGSESEPLPMFKHLGMFTDSILFGEEMQIRFMQHPHQIANYETDVDEFEIINDSEEAVTVRCFEKIIEVNPHSVASINNT